MFSLAPIYYHFGDISFVLDIIAIGYDVVDILGTYYITFFFISFFLFYRNFFFNVFNNFFFKNYSSNLNRVPFLNYFSLFYSKLKKFFKFRKK